MLGALDLHFAPQHAAEKIEFAGAIAYDHSTSWYVKDPTGWSIEVVLWHEDEPAFS